jgi:hypothetical protein
MDGVSIIIGVLTFVFIVVVLGMNFVNSTNTMYIEKFEDTPSSTVEPQIRAVLDKLTNKDICAIYDKIRSTMAKNETAGPAGVSDTEAAKRVEANLAIKIPGGALKCPLFKYPKAGSSDLEWLSFLQTIPPDFGARIVFMAIFAKEYLADIETTLKSALSGNGTVPKVESSEGFAVCTPDVAATRRAEKAEKTQGVCTLPEEMSKKEIEDAITDLLKKLVSEKNTILKSKQIDPTININPLIAEANKSLLYIDKKSQQAQDGTLAIEEPITLKPKAKEATE